jgi:hypothetical protein
METNIDLKKDLKCKHITSSSTSFFPYLLTFKIQSFEKLFFQALLFTSNVQIVSRLCFDILHVVIYN